MKWLTSLVAVAVLGVGGYYGWRTFGHKDAAPPAPVAVPVTAVEARQQDVPVYLRGIGSVRALNGVEIHPQVGGVLVSVPVKEGDEVKQGTVLAVIDPRPFQAALDKAKAQLAQDQAQLDNAQTDLKRYTTLARSDFASRQQVDTQTSSVNRFQGVVAADDAAIEEAQINLTYCVLRAPMDGRIGLRRVDPGNLVQANGTGAGILSIMQDHPITAVFTLPETDLPAVKAAMARGPVEVLADISGQADPLARGLLLTPDNMVDQTSGTIGMKAQFPNDDGKLTPGQFISVRVQVDTAHGVAVPHEAVQHGQGGLFVFTIKPDKTAERRDVQVTYDDGAVTVLGKGVNAGDQVVTAGQTRVGPGTKVATRDDAASDQRAQK